MISKFLLFSVGILVVFSIKTEGKFRTTRQVVTEPNIINVSVYYETHCPDSKRFITRQLHPVYNTLKDRMKIEFIPYGKASQYRNPDGSWTFHCQHYERECSGNTYQACALAQKIDENQKVNFVNCAMSLYDPSSSDDLKQCAEENNLNWEQMSKCHSQKEGADLLATYGDETKRLGSDLSFVPTVVFNKNFNQRLQDQSQYDFSGTLCSLLTPQPRSCGSSISY